MYAMPNLLTFVKRFLLVATVLIVGGFLAAALLMLWLQLTVAVWGNYGDATFQYYLIGCALLLMLILVIIW